MLALGIGISFLLMVKNYRRHGWAGVVATGLVIGLAVGTFFTVLPLNELRQLAATSNQPLLVNSIGRSAQSSNERSLLIRESIELYQRSDGVIGLGPASTKPLLGAGLYPYANEAHDDFLAALSERGVIGLFALVLLGGSVIARASPVLSRQLSAPMAAAVPFPAGIVAGVLAVGVNSFYEEVLHFRPLWLLFGIIAVLGRDAWRMRQSSQQRRFARLRPAAMTELTIRPPGKLPGLDGTAAVERTPSPRTLCSAGSRGSPGCQGTAGLAVAVQARRHQSGRTGRCPSGGVAGQPAGREDRRSHCGRRVRTYPRAALAIRGGLLLWPADRLGILPRR